MVNHQTSLPAHLTAVSHQSLTPAAFQWALSTGKQDGSAGATSSRSQVRRLLRRGSTLRRWAHGRHWIVVDRGPQYVLSTVPPQTFSISRGGWRLGSAFTVSRGRRPRHRRRAQTEGRILVFNCALPAEPLFDRGGQTMHARMEAAHARRAPASRRRRASGSRISPSDSIEAAFGVCAPQVLGVFALLLEVQPGVCVGLRRHRPPSMEVRCPLCRLEDCPLTGIADRTTRDGRSPSRGPGALLAMQLNL